MTARKVVVLDYGSGNLRSAQRALDRVGADVTVTPDLTAAAEADGLVVPGVGAYAACMAGIEAARPAGRVIADRVAAGRPVLGICVGMQVLFEAGEEHGVVTKGLGLLPGHGHRLGARRVPHMGWNTVAPPADSVLFAGLPATPGSTSSTRTPPTTSMPGATLCTHEAPFVAAVERGALSATQFHPEKSGDAGATLLGNWLATLG